MARDRKGKGKGKSKSDRFAYKSRDSKKAAARAEQGGGDFDKLFKDEVQGFAPNDGDNLIRPLPPTWEDPEHYGYDIYVHYGIGADNNAYLCRKKMLNEACPICEEQKRAEREGDEEYSKQLKPKQRVAFYLLDRDDEEKGVQIWASPWGFDRDVCKISVDKRSGEVLELDNPEDGYDIEFERTGKGIKTKYEGVKIARKASDLDNDEALEFVNENSIPDILNFYSYEHIEDVFNGGGSDSSSKKEEEEGKKPKRSRGTKKEKEGEAEEESNYTYDDLAEMNHRKLKKVAKEIELDEDVIDDSDEDELFDAICDELGIEIPEEGGAEPEEEPEPEEEEEEEKPSKRKKGRSKMDEIKKRRAKKK